MDQYRQHELPETVKRYKTYTDSFQEWLMRTAVQRGVEHAARISEQAKKRSKGKKKYKISTKQQELLVDGIADSEEPLDDTSGLRDLEVRLTPSSPMRLDDATVNRDAIRSRKEITQFHNFFKTLDDGHAFFNVVLDTAQSKLTALIRLIPVLLKAQDLEDEASTFSVLRFDSDELEVGDNETGETDQEDSKFDDGETSRQDIPTFPRKKLSDNPLSKQEAELQREFLVLVFLYEFNRVRQLVREVWLLFRHKALNLISAALVTDLAQSYIEQNIAALIENLDSYDTTPRLSLIELVLQLYNKLSAGDMVLSSAPISEVLPNAALRHILCVDAINHLKAHLEPIPPATDGDSPNGEPQFPSRSFLRYFDAIRRSKVALPIWDKFTECMIPEATLRRQDNSNAFLPFGFQLVLDVEEVIRKDDKTIYTAVTEQSLDIARLIRTHVEYEDHMWSIDRKPDYMAGCDVKFSNVYLSSLDALLKWVQELLKDNEPAGLHNGMSTDDFVVLHPTLAGLSIWNFNKTYHGFSIAKVRWFVTTLSHLYNAAIEVGGLQDRWEDLEYIIESHGHDRIFVGGPPVDPQDFLDRYNMSICVSSRALAKDFKPKGKFLPVSPAELKKTRGLMSHFPLEDAIAKYYGPDKNGDRWVRRHAVFNKLHQLSKDQLQDQHPADMRKDTKYHQALISIFDWMSSKIAPPKSKNRRKKKPRIRIPDYGKVDDEYATLFRTMCSELQAHELHSNFDYLAFFRRANEIVLRIRNEVLHDNALQLARRSDMHKAQNPDNFTLITELFSALQIKPKDKKTKVTGGEVSTEVVPLEQLKRIAEIMDEVIHEEGNMELDRAKMRLAQDWDGLKAEYAADEDTNFDSPSAPGVPLAADARSFGDSQPSGAFPDQATEDLGKCKVSDEVVHVSDELADFPPEDNTSPPTYDFAEFAGPGSSRFTSFEDYVQAADIVSSLDTIYEEDCTSDLDDDSVSPRRLHQAYVSDEADEPFGWASDGSTLTPPRSSFDFATPAFPTTFTPAALNDDASINASVGDPEVDQTATKCVAQKPKRAGRPKGIFHRLTFYSTFRRRRPVIVRGASTTPRLAVSRRRQDHRILFSRIASKRTVSIKCYALCSLARVLSGRKSRLQRRLQMAVNTVLAKKSSSVSELQMAWKLASRVHNGENVEEEVWESDGEVEAH